MNLGEWSISKSVITWALTLVFIIGGWITFFHLPRLEDPEFTIKQAVVVTPYPGASAEEVEKEVSDVIERAAQELGQLFYVESTSSRGMSQVKVYIKDQYDKKKLPQVWDELRRKVHDYQSKLPPGAGPSVVNDSFGDVYGIYVVLTGKGYTMAELKEYAKYLRREIVRVQDVQRVELWGDDPEAVYVEMSRPKMAALGISQQQIYEALRSKNLPADAGRLTIHPEWIPVNPTGEFKSVQDFGNLLIVSRENGRSVYLRDVATIHRGYVEPPAKIMRFDGQRGIALGISTVAGGNVVTMGEGIQNLLKQLRRQTPRGMDLHIVSMQSQSVVQAINGFMVNLVEAVLIVIVVLLFFMGFRAGLIVGFALFITISGTFLFMGAQGVVLERISLGALIIALGMLVDNAIVVVDGMKVKIEAGIDGLQAAKDVVGQQAVPLLGATAVAILAFAAIGTSQDSTGEYCRSLFTVILISLSFSWVVAMTTTPLITKLFMKPKKGADTSKDPYGGALFRGYRAFLEAAIRWRWVTLVFVAVIFALSVWGFGKVDKMFFPDSTRPQFYVELYMPEGTHILDTEKAVEKVEKYLHSVDGITDVASAIGGGDLRFLLTYSPIAASPSNAVIFASVKDWRLLNTIVPEVQEKLVELLPGAIASAKKFRLGPGEGGRIQLRISGTNREQLREYAKTAKKIMAEYGAISIRDEWKQKVKVIEPVMDDARAHQLGIERPQVAQAIKAVFEGVRTGVYRERDELLPIIARAPAPERMDIDSLNDVLIWSPVARKMIPLRQVVTGFKTVFEDANIWRRGRKTTIKIHCDPPSGMLPSDLFKIIKPKIEQALGVDVSAYYGKALPKGAKYTASTIPVTFNDQIPLKNAGYTMAWGGEAEDSAKGQSYIMGSIPKFFVIMVLVVVFLFNSVRQPLIIWITVPLALIGVTAGLLLFHQPFGFMAMLGFLSLSGMLIKNAVVLIDQINVEIRGGKEQYHAVVDSGVSRLIPVSMAAATTILGMLPLFKDAFFVSMAVTIAMGLLFATVLTLIVVPTLYTVFYRIPHPKRTE